MTGGAGWVNVPPIEALEALEVATGVLKPGAGVRTFDTGAYQAKLTCEDPCVCGRHPSRPPKLALPILSLSAPDSVVAIPA